MADDIKLEEGSEETSAPKAKSQGMMPLLLTSVILAVVLGGVGFALAYFVVPARLAARRISAARDSSGIIACALVSRSRCSISWAMPMC